MSQVSEVSGSSEEEDSDNAAMPPELGNPVVPPEDNPGRGAPDPDPNALVTQGTLRQVLGEVLDEVLDKKLKKRFKKELKPIKKELESINLKLDHLVAASPHAAMTIESKSIPVVETRGEYRAEMTRASVARRVAITDTKEWWQTIIQGNTSVRYAALGSYLYDLEPSPIGILGRDFMHVDLHVYDRSLYSLLLDVI